MIYTSHSESPYWSGGNSFWNGFEWSQKNKVVCLEHVQGKGQLRYTRDVEEDDWVKSRGQVWGMGSSKVHVTVFVLRSVTCYSRPHHVCNSISIDASPHTRNFPFKKSKSVFPIKKKEFSLKKNLKRVLFK